MRTSLSTILAGAALVSAVALAAGATNPATARDDDTHTLLVQLPNGLVEQIEYTGDVAPQVAFPEMGVSMVAPIAVVHDPAFAAIDQIMALMDRQVASMMQREADMPTWTRQIGDLPPGATGYSVMTTLTSNGACSRSTRVTYSGGNAAPQTVSDVSGDCVGVPSRGTVPIEMPAPVRPRAAHTIQAKANVQPQPYEIASLR